MGRDVVSAKLDVIFKKIFTENRDMLHDFISAILDIPSEKITEITITNPELPPESALGKFSRLDLSLKVDDKLVNVEIQVKEHADYRDRTLFYWAKLYTSELKSGEDYGDLKQTIAINIINFNMFGGENYHNEVVTTIKDTGEIFSDKFSIHFFELKKISRKPNPKNRKELWLQYINADKEEELAMIENTNVPIMQKAVRVIYDMSEDTRVREIARMREKALHDEATYLREAMEKGIVQGRAEGFALAKEGFIAKLKAKGMTDSEIADFLE